MRERERVSESGPLRQRENTAPLIKSETVVLVPLRMERGREFVVADGGVRGGRRRRGR